MATKIAPAQKEQGDFAAGMHGNVEHRPSRRQVRGQGRPQNHVTQLADGRERQATLEVVLRHRDQGGDQDGGAGQDHQPVLAAEIDQDFGPVNVRIHPIDAKDAHLDHRHRMKKSRNRSGRDHRSGQPRMQGHQPGLGETEGEQGQESQLGYLREGTDLSGIGEKIHGDLPAVEPDVTPTQGWKQEAKRGEKQVTEVGSSSRPGLLVLHVSDQGNVETESIS